MKEKKERFIELLCSTGREGSNSYGQNENLDRFRSCDLQIHNLTLYLLSYKLHFVAPEGVEPSLTEPKPVVLPLYHRAMFRTDGGTRTHIHQLRG